MENDTTVIISSHDLKELDNICDRVAIMHEGEIIKEEELEKLKSDLKRVQFAIDKEFEVPSNEAFKILKTLKLGSVYICTIKGDTNTFKKDLENKYNVLLFDELPMNLEEIFITELGDKGYGTEIYQNHFDKQ
jgi:ABC-2 type transport system ATP-binding protein